MTIVSRVLITLVFLLPLAWLPGSAGFGFPKSALLLAVAGGLAIRQVGRRRHEGESSARVMVLWLLVGAAAVSIVVHPSRHGVWSLLLLTAWVAIVHGLAVSPDRRLLRSLTMALLMGMALAVVLDLLRRAGVQWALPVPRGAAPGVTTVGNRNYTAGVAAILFWPGIVMAAGRKSLLRKAMVGLVPSLLLVEVILVGSAGPILALVGGGLLVLACRLLARRFCGLPLALLPGVGLAFSLALALALCGTTVPRWGAAGEPGALVGKVAGEASVGERARMWQAATWLFASHPMTGVGLGRYRAEWPTVLLRQNRRSADRTPRGRSTVCHQEYLQWLAETGGVGLLAIFVVLARWRHVVIDCRVGGKAAGIAPAGGLTAGVIHALVSFPAHLPVASLAWGMILAGVLHGEAREPYAWRRRWRIPVVVWGGLALVFWGTLAWESGLEILRARADRQAAVGDSRKAAGNWQKVARWSLRPELTPLWLALEERCRGHDTRAARWLRLHLDDMPTDQGYRELARLRVEQGRYRQATTLLEYASALRQRRTDRSEVCYLRGIVAKETGDTVAARAYWREALRHYARNYRAHLGLGYLDLLAGDTAGARRHYRRAETIIAVELERVRSRGEKAPELQLKQDWVVVRRALASLPAPEQGGR